MPEGGSVKEAEYRMKREITNYLRELQGKLEASKMAFSGDKTFVFKPGALDTNNVQAFLTKFSEVEPHWRYALTHTSFAGKYGMRMLRLMDRIRKIKDRPPWLIFPETVRLLRAILSHLNTAIDGAIHATMARMDDFNLVITSQLTANVAILDSVQYTAFKSGDKEKAAEKDQDGEEAPASPGSKPKGG